MIKMKIFSFVYLNFVAFFCRFFKFYFFFFLQIQFYIPKKQNLDS